jgi:ferredoxin-NADP reductase
MPHTTLPQPAEGYAAAVTERWAATPNVSILRLRVVDRGFTFLPGQWIDVRLPDSTPAERGAYSICSRPDDTGYIELAVKANTAHSVTHYLTTQAKPGDRLHISGAQGTMGYKPEPTPHHLVLIGAGTGLAPMLSILRHVNVTEPQRQVTLIHSATTPLERLFGQELEAIAAANPRVRCIVTLTREAPAQWQGRTGRINLRLLEQLGLDRQATYFLCGPPRMVDDVAQALLDFGVPAAAHRYDKWW